jgi:hypothetical protein
VTDEDIVLYGNALADKRMTLNLTILADSRAFLYLDECSDPRVISDFAAVEIDEVIYFDASTELHIIGNILHRHTLRRNSPFAHQHQNQAVFDTVYRSKDHHAPTSTLFPHMAQQIYE